MLLEIAVFILVTGILISIIDEYFQPKTGLPRVGTDPGPLNLLKWWARWNWLQHGHEDVIRTYEQKSAVKNYAIQTMMGDTVVLQPEFLGELNMLPESKLSSTAALVDSVMGQYTGVDHLLKDHLTTDICRGSFTRHLGTFLPIMAEELQTAMAEKFQFEGNYAPESQTFVAYDVLLSFIHRITSVVFVGKEYGHDPVWNHAITILPTDVEMTKLILLPFPTFLRRFIAPMIPQRNRVFRQRIAVRNLLFPSSKEITALKQEEPSVMKLFVESGKDKSPESITARLMILTGAALHTSSMAIAHAVYDLCAMPEYIEPLRLEAQTALAQEKGEWTLSVIKRLYRLDSFLKESQRMNHSSFLGFNRKIMSSIRLSDGTILPRDTVVAAPGGPMSRDPKFYDEPQRFDGLRFYRADDSRDASSASTQDYVGIEPGNLSWGNGRFTCPGRWYAAVMIKLILAKLLLEFDVSFPPGQTGRPLNGKYDTDVHPDFDQKIVLRRRPTV
ncbi:Ent-kaurene oxidase [Cytospora mali]|uniref:Ent-kaurene oxidase n=1 Tax=Cytospora mali TaxID=578113 RepID=A0A194W8K2_CYTMA|nr:Ent-kaurene oxidase [Valsa mali]